MTVKDDEHTQFEDEKEAWCILLALSNASFMSGNEPSGYPNLHHIILWALGACQAPLKNGIPLLQTNKAWGIEHTNVPGTKDPSHRLPAALPGSPRVSLSSSPAPTLKLVWLQWCLPGQGRIPSRKLNIVVRTRSLSSRHIVSQRGAGNPDHCVNELALGFDRRRLIQIHVARDIKRETGSEGRWAQRRGGHYLDTSWAPFTCVRCTFWIVFCEQSVSHGEKESLRAGAQSEFAVSGVVLLPWFPSRKSFFVARGKN
ncbi:hypothetical protein B0H11DRAFT_1944227 [Mycena galericulata]|nr:hypothetical protein B0H11DRAFT_1944227 [Mycena galericulata]